MIDVAAIQVRLSSLLEFAQAPVIIEDGSPPEAASVLFSGPQFFIALISGILLAFAFQIVLTNLSVAAGISYLGRSSDSEQTDQSGPSIRKIGVGVGVWTLITVTLSLFLACLLAVQLSLLTSGNLGAIVGLVIWAAYFSLLVWISSTTIGSLIGSVVNSATAGFQAILGTATAAIGGAAAKRQTVATAEAVAAAVRHELGADLDPSSIRRSIEDYIGRLSLPGFDFPRIRQDFEGLLNDPEVQELAAKGQLRHINRQTFIDLISKRTDFSNEEVNRLADLLEAAWRQTLGRSRQRDQTAELIDYLQSTQPGQIQVNDLNDKIERLLAERKGSSSGQGGLQGTLQSGLNTAVGLLVGRTDLSDLDLEGILNRLKTAPDTVKDQGDRLAGQLRLDQPEPYSPIRTDVEQYLLNTYSWEMTPERVARDFRNLLYDPNADPAVVAEQIAHLDRAFFAETLASRGVFTQDRIRQLARILEEVRREVLETARLAQEREAALDLHQRVDIYLRLTPREQLHTTQDGILPAFEALLTDADADYETLQRRLSPLDRGTLSQLLTQRPDRLSLEERESILNQLDATRHRVLAAARSEAEQNQSRLSSAQRHLEEYLLHTAKPELTSTEIRHRVRQILENPQLGLSELRRQTTPFDREGLIRSLNQRPDMSEAEVEQIVDQVEASWNRTIGSSPQLTAQAQQQYEQTLGSLRDYLRQTNLEELDPDGIQRDLTMLLDNPREGALALRRRLAKIDRQTLVRLLEQRQDLSEAQINRTLDQVQEAIRRIVKTPQRLALRAQQQVVDFETSVEEYLRHTDKEELNPEGIKRDLQLLTTSPRYGMQNLSDRLSRFDRSTLVALLAQRQDMTREEAERIVLQVELVRDQILDQLRQIQFQIQATIDRVFARLRDYLNSLNRPELNYDGIKQDISTLLDDPQAGFEALRQRLGQFDRGTLVALLSSRRDISEADANRIIDQIESARTNVLQRAEQVQLEAQRRLEEVKYQAQRQMEETRKAAAAAAWWLFLTASVSAIAAAGAGALAST